jgi:hypothetical protein
MNPLRVLILESSYYRSGEPFKACNIQTILHGRHKAGEISYVRAELRSLEIDGFVKCLERKVMHEAFSYVRCTISGVPDPIRMKWRKRDDIPNHSPVWC